MPVTNVVTRWIGGELVFYDKYTMGEIFRIKDSTDGVVFTKKVTVGSEVIAGSRFAVNIGPKTASDYQTEATFFVAPAACKLVEAGEIHVTQEGTTGWIDIYKNHTVAIGNGTKMLATGFNVSSDATNETYVTKELTNSTGILTLAAGDRVSIKGSAMATLAGSYVSCIFEWV